MNKINNSNHATWFSTNKILFYFNTCLFLKWPVQKGCKSTYTLVALSVLVIMLILSVQNSCMLRYILLPFKKKMFWSTKKYCYHRIWSLQIKYCKKYTSIMYQCKKGVSSSYCIVALGISVTALLHYVFIAGIQV